MVELFLIWVLISSIGFAIMCISFDKVLNLGNLKVAMLCLLFLPAFVSIWTYSSIKKIVRRNRND